MKPTLKKQGQHTLNVEVTNITIHGFWLYIVDKEYFLPFSKFPWFKKATIENIQNVELIHTDHLYWPSIDIDIELDCIENPDNYPLISV